MNREIPGDDVSLNDAPDEACVADVIERLDGLWSEERRAAAEELPSLIGHRCGKYTIRSIIGRGAFGVVYRASDDLLQRDVALKVPRPEVLVDEERLGRFENEATATASLTHPAIVPVYEANLSGPVPYIASAYCAGPDLCEWLAGRTIPVEAADAAWFVAQLAAPVDHAHQQGVLHRDLKPSNILLEPIDGDSRNCLASFQPRLTDFGLAKLLEGSLQDTRSSLLVGTPLYMAPEQLASEVTSISPATDVYALGVVLFELVTLKTPFDGTTYVEVLDKLRTQPPPSLSEVNPRVPKDLGTICTKCLEKDPADRYRTASALRDDLQRFLDEEPILATPATWRSHLLRWCRQPQRIITTGWFTCWFQLLIVWWMCLVLLVGVVVGAFPDGPSKAALDIFFICATAHLPLAALGWQMWSGRRWPFWPSGLLSIILLGILIHAATHTGMVFSHLYPTPFSKVNTYTMLIMGSVMQIGLYLLAIPAWLRSRLARN